jgi:DNA-binding transcriptional ArsR family regulator
VWITHGVRDHLDMTTPQSEPRLDIHEPSGMRALAHPARVAALQYLMMVGPATSTELGSVVGLSASAMSYHLRNLERAGMVETAPGRGDGRERVWRSIHGSREIDAMTATPELRQASVELIEAMLAIQEMRVRRWLLRGETDLGWLDTGYFTEGVLLITATELADLGERLRALAEPYVQRTRVDPPPDARTVSAVFRAFPIDEPPREGVDLREPDVKE